MKFEIESKFNIGDTVSLKSTDKAKVLNVALNLFGNYYRIRYLLEFGNQERKWTDEAEIME